MRYTAVVTFREASEFSFVEPFAKRAATGLIVILADVNHHSDGIIYFTIWVFSSLQ